MGFIMLVMETLLPDYGNLFQIELQILNRKTALKIESVSD